MAKSKTNTAKRPTKPQGNEVEASREVEAGSYRTPLLVGHDNATAIKGAVANMKETLAGYDYIKANDAAWYERVTPPSRSSRSGCSR